jgi:hypothetical protein
MRSHYQNVQIVGLIGMAAFTDNKEQVKKKNFKT